MYRIIAVIALLSLPWFAVTAAVYKHVLPDGSVVYSDRPAAEDAAEIKLPSVNLLPATPVPPPSEPPPVAEEKADHYGKIQITQPKPDEAIRENTGRVRVSVMLSAPLLIDEGHRLTFALDGRLVGQPQTEGGYTLENVDRGTHTVEAMVVDAQGRTLARSDAVTFHLHRFSALLPPSR